MSSDKDRPRASILIPNFNNGRQSAVDGATDFLGELFQSLYDTLAHDPTLLEIIVQDDGSTDDSLETARAWSKRTWRGGRPFCRLIEGEHCGVLSIVANNLTREARGDVLIRLDGDIKVLTLNWLEKIVRVLDHGPPRLGIVGPKQLTPDGRIHAAGDWILHPRGMHHIAQGAPRDAVTQSFEVDHVMGCFYCYRREVFDDVGGFDENYLRGQTIDFGMMARLRGWRTWFVPHVEFIHNHFLRKRRETKADSDPGVDESLLVFERKWGFNRLAPDLDEVKRRYPGTPLLWNPRVFGPGDELPQRATKPLSPDETEWARFANDELFRTWFKPRLEVVGCIVRVAGPRNRIVQVMSRAGLATHLMAKEGLSVVGVDPDPQFIALARTIAHREHYPGDRPEYVLQPDLSTIPLPDGSVDTVLLGEIMEIHPNPVALLREAHRVLAPNGALGIVTAKRGALPERDGDARHPFRAHELELMLIATRLFKVMNATSMSSAKDQIVMLGAKKESRPQQTTPAPKAVGVAT